MRKRRLTSHRLSAPAATLVDAARHMLATQAQEFWGGRWALAARTRGQPTVRDADAAFGRGELVRTWTMRGTLHVVASEDLDGILSITGGRQFRMAQTRHRQLGLDDETFARAERAARAALAGGGRLTRTEFARMLDTAGIDPSGQRGIHLIQALALRGVVVWGPVVPREGGPSREQYLVLADEWIAASATPPDAAAELFTRYIASHGPATLRDFAWWSGLPLGESRSAAIAAEDRVTPVDDAPEPAYVAAVAPPRRSSAAPDVLALPSFEEYYLSYADRTAVCSAARAAAIGPSQNGMVRPVIVAHGHVVGVWSHSRAAGRHEDEPVAELFPGEDVAIDQSEVAAALARYAAFIAG